MSDMHGNLSINSDNIFHIIKKWLYSDHDIFFRELISNGCDAITKLKKLDMMGEYNIPSNEEFRIDVIVNQNDKTIKFIDNGVGMTFDEVNEYINQIAFSGAEAFIEQYKDKTTSDQIIGHFGLGFYSAFMVADKVTIDTLSYKDDAQSVHWECDGGTKYTMSASQKDTRGTEITLYLNSDSTEFSNEYRAKEVIEKYCSFMPTQIFLTNAIAEKKEDDNEVSLNDTNPLWNKHPNECSDDDYKAFYRKVFKDYKEPLFWIHLNMDYPFNLKGILYFPKLNSEYDTLEGTIKLYNTQVFIADNIKEVIPEFLLLLKGVIDCPDLPLNVSRSALQNDGFVKKISDYITKKVADKLSGMCKTDKDNYIKYWDDISPFIKFGCLKDDKFCEKMNDYILFKDIYGSYNTLPEYLEANKERHENTVFYVTNELEQGQYINMFKEEGLSAVLLMHNIDQPFVSYLEHKNENVKFMRIDSDLNDTFKDTSDENVSEELNTILCNMFKKSLNKDKLEIKVEKLKNTAISSMITLSEEGRRMQDMMKMYNLDMGNMGIDKADGQTLILNANHELVKYLFENTTSPNNTIICEQLYDLALLSHAPLSAEQMTAFIKRSNEIMLLLTK